MSFNIKEKLEKLVLENEFNNEEYQNYTSYKVLNRMIYISLLVLIMPMFFGTNTVEIFREGNSSLLSLITAISLLVIGSFSIVTFFVAITERKFFFNIAKDKTMSEKLLAKEFGSVSKAITLYNRLKKLNIPLTDKNFKHYYDSYFYEGQNEKIMKIDEKISFLEKEKKRIIEKEGLKIMKNIDKKEKKEKKEDNKSIFLNISEGISVPDFAKIRS